MYILLLADQFSCATMDAPPSYTQCSTHPTPEDCLEHALNREHSVVIQSDRMRHCLQQFFSRCKARELAILLGYAQPNLRPLAPKTDAPIPTSIHTANGQNAVSGPTQQGPLLGELRPRPVDPAPYPQAPHPPAPQAPAPEDPVPQPLAPQPRVPNKQGSSKPQPGPNKPKPKQPGLNKRKRTRSGSIESITSGTNSESDTESERASSRQRLSSSPLLQLQRQRTEGGNTVDPESRRIYFSGVEVAKIEAILDAFLPVHLCESIELPSFHCLRASFASDDRPSTVESEGESRLQRHITTIKDMMSSLNNARTVVAIYGRINFFLIQFEIDMINSGMHTQGRRGVRRQAYTITEIAGIWGESETWMKKQIRKASKYMQLSEEHPSYLTELQYKNDTKWWESKDAESIAILTYFREKKVRQSANRQYRDFLVCERIIERLRRVGWEFSEIAASKSKVTEILSKHIDLERLSKGQISPLASFEKDGGHNDGENEHIGEQADPLLARRSLSLAAEHSAAENTLSVGISRVCTINFSLVTEEGG
ncbi:hypothetical protein B0J12DRAFT_664038 [Macrophomina phaseolina]|uniref:Uncharacterized protein n=1 Tax=Macrophomina phaseolina TaxID=35725 RepID=A0ABQ8G949_9PEZI|nr:hypothetical protein B0J12DRAFT_664038 [Macrophomina phaseolina]